MDCSHDELRRRIDAFQLDDPTANLTFTQRLARENGWDHAFAKRVVAEYKRFLFLAMTAGHTVSPSDEVDQAWHLHLTYTHSYWDDLCGEVLGRPLHHGPTKGGREEGQRFEQLYEQTLTSYREAFGEPAPADIWPPTEVRFGEAPSYVRVNRRRCWVTPKPWRLADRRPLVLAGSWLAVAPPIAMGATMNPLDMGGPEFLTFYGVVCVVAAVGAIVCRSVLRTQTANESAIDFGDPAEVAALRGGWQNTVYAATAGLIRSDALRVDRKAATRSNGPYRFLATREPQEGDSLLERVLLKAAGQDGGELHQLKNAGEPVARQSQQRLEDAGFLETPTSFAAPRIASVLLVGSALALGVAKLVAGISRDRPVGFLIVALVALVGLTIWLMRKPLRTPAGNRKLEQLGAGQSQLKRRAAGSWHSLDGGDAFVAVALFGLPACGGTELVGLRDAARGTSAVGHGGISSGGCDSGGGSGCGSGCGGCGGCGD